MVRVISQDFRKRRNLRQRTLRYFIRDSKRREVLDEIKSFYGDYALPVLMNLNSVKHHFTGRLEDLARELLPSDNSLQSVCRERVANQVKVYSGLVREAASDLSFSRSSLNIPKEELGNILDIVVVNNRGYESSSSSFDKVS